MSASLIWKPQGADTVECRARAVLRLSAGARVFSASGTGSPAAVKGLAFWATLPPPMRPRQLRRPTPINWREWTRGRGMA